MIELTLREFALEKDIDIEDLLELCKELELNITDYDYVLNDEEIKLLEENLETFLSNNRNISGNYSEYNNSGSSSTTYSERESTYVPSSTKTITDSNNNLSLKDSFLSEINYDAEDIYYANENIKQLSNDFEKMSDSFENVNITSTEISLEGLNSSKNTISSVKSEVIDKLKTNVSTIKELISLYDENAALLFDTLEEENNNNGDYGDLTTAETEDDIFEEEETEAVVEDEMTEDTSTEEPDFSDDVPDLELPDTDMVEDTDKEKDTDTGITSDTSNLQPKNNSTISHRGYNTGPGIGWNILDHFVNAGEQGYWGCEADVRFDSNGNLICSHNAVQAGENPPLFSDYLDVCKDYGMTAIIDLKYSNGWTDMDRLAPAVIELIDEKDMFDSCIIQTQAAKDIPQIRALSDDVRIWFLTDEISDKNIEIIKDNNVEGVNIQLVNFSTYQLNKLTENEIDVCVWNVYSESQKERLLNQGVKYVMTDNPLDVTPYQEGDVDFNNLDTNVIN